MKITALTTILLFSITSSMMKTPTQADVTTNYNKIKDRVMVLVTEKFNTCKEACTHEYHTMECSKQCYEISQMVMVKILSAIV